MKTYKTLVLVQGVEYEGQSVRGKKNAETSAAEAALISLKLIEPKES